MLQKLEGQLLDVIKVKYVALVVIKVRQVTFRCYQNWIGNLKMLPKLVS